MNLEGQISKYVNEDAMNVEFSKNLLQLNSGLTVTKDIVTNKGILLAKKGYILTKEQKERLIDEKFSQIEDHVPLSDRVDQEKILEYVSNINLKLSSIGYNFDKELELIDSFLSEIDLSTKLSNKLTIFKEKNPSKFEDLISIGLLSLILKQTYTNEKSELKEIFTSSLFHRIGELYVEPISNNEILSAKEKSRQEVIPVVSYLVLKNSKSDFSKNVLETILSHAEYIDGSGYPRKLTGKEMTLDAKILSLTRNYNALIREGKNHLNAISILGKLSYSNIDLNGKIIMPKYNESCFNRLKKQNFETKEILDLKSQAKFEELVENLKNQYKETCSYLVFLNAALNTKAFNSDLMKTIRPEINKCMSFYASSGILESSEKISEVIFTKDILDPSLYGEMQNRILPATLDLLHLIKSELLKYDSKNNILDYYHNKLDGLINNLTTSVQNYSNLH